MSGKHTPEPWRASKDIDTRGRHGWRIDSESRSLMAWAAWPSEAERDSEEAEATIRLMTAAPKLLAALKECELFLRVYGLDHPNIATLSASCRDVIAEAQPNPRQED